MCTVILEVPDSQEASIRVLAIREEQPDRPWDPPGPWWPAKRPGVVGVRDRRAGGAWLAARGAPPRLAVILNRAERVALHPRYQGEPLESRGHIVLNAVEGTDLPDAPRTESFNLVTATSESVELAQWNGDALRRSTLDPGIHMIAHHGLDDRSSARIDHWLPKFQQLRGISDDAWRASWTSLLASSAEMNVGDDRALIRDNRVHGYPTLSLLACRAEIGRFGVRLESAPLPAPARWNGADFVPVLIPESEEDSR